MSMERTSVAGLIVIERVVETLALTESASLSRKLVLPGRSGVPEMMPV